MKTFALATFGCVLLAMLAKISPVQAAPPPAWAPEKSAALQQLVDQAVGKVLADFAAKNVQSNQLAVTLVDWRNPAQPVQASFRGNEQVYPASVVKMFYLAAAHRWLEDGKLQDSEEFRRALRDMIVDSSNDATALIVDMLTDTTGGPELPPKELEAWYEKRNAVSRYYAALGYQNINCNRKPWNEGPYGREMQSVKAHRPNHRNWLTTDATARLLSEIATDKCVSPARCEEMRKLLKRDPFTKSGDVQAMDYTGVVLPKGSQLWSKAGWTSESRHDAAYVILPDGTKFVLVTFTSGQASTKGIIHSIAKSVVDELPKLPKAK